MEPENLREVNPNLSLDKKRALLNVEQTTPENLKPNLKEKTKEWFEGQDAPAKQNILSEMVKNMEEEKIISGIEILKHKAEPGDELLELLRKTLKDK